MYINILEILNTRYQKICLEIENIELSIKYLDVTISETEKLFIRSNYKLLKAKKLLIKSKIKLIKSLIQNKIYYLESLLANKNFIFYGKKQTNLVKIKIKSIENKIKHLKELLYNNT